MRSDYDAVLEEIDNHTPVLIAGPTASGKSDLALTIAEQAGGVIVNADALQVYENWSVLTARPQPQDLARADHALYGHVAKTVAYTVGDWLRDVTPLLQGPQRPIIVGGTGLFFRALTEGLAEIPQIPADIRDQAQAIWKDAGLDPLLSDLDPTTKASIDTENPARVMRAWEVQRATGRSIKTWQNNTPAPALPLSDSFAILLDADKDWLSDRISRRFDLMIGSGALEEVDQNAADWNPELLANRAIGAPELMAYAKGEMSLDQAKTQAIIATRQYAKRQRTWFRKRMIGWHRVALG